MKRIASIIAGCIALQGCANLGVHPWERAVLAREDMQLDANTVDTALDEFDTTRTVDVIAELAFPLPFVVISRMLGMPQTDALRLRDWSHTMTKTLDPILSDDDIRAASDAEELMNAAKWRSITPR